jgi:hypothetical protein
MWNSKSHVRRRFEKTQLLQMIEVNNNHFADCFFEKVYDSKGAYSLGEVELSYTNNKELDYNEFVLPNSVLKKIYEDINIKTNKMNRLNYSQILNRIKTYHIEEKEYQIYIDDTDEFRRVILKVSDNIVCMRRLYKQN